MQSGNKRKRKKGIVIDSDTKDEMEGGSRNKKNKLVSRFDELEYQERDLALKERELALREREAKIHVIELSNLEKEHQYQLIRLY